LIVEVVSKQEEQHQDILHTIRIFEGKFEAICKAVFIIGISISQVIEETEVTTHKQSSHGLKGTMGVFPKIQIVRGSRKFQTQIDRGGPSSFPRLLMHDQVSTSK